MNTRWLAYALALVALMVFGYACKSDGGVTYITVLQISPEDQRTEVQVETRVGFQIDAPIDQAELTNETFFVADSEGTKVEGELSIDEDDPAVAIFNPDDSLDVITNYTATITTGLAARGGATLEENFEWEFMTLDSEWGVSEWIETTATGISKNQQIVVDGQSNALSIWEYDLNETDASGIWANRYTRVDLWGLPEQIDAGDGGSRNPALAADDAGNAFAVWEEVGENFDANIWSNRYTVGQGWGTPERLQSSVLSARAPSVAADAAGNAIAVWLEEDFVSGNFLVWARRYEPGSGWGTAAPFDGLPTPSAPGTRTAVEMDADSNAIALWSQGTVPVDGGRGGQLWANRYVAGEGWDTSRPIKSDTETTAEDQRLSVSPNGEAHVVWVQYVDTTVIQTRQDIWSVRYAPGSDWAGDDWRAPARVDGYDDGNKEAPDIAVDGTGMAHAVWSQKDQILTPDFVNIYANRYTPGAGWSTAVLIEPANEDPREDGDATQPRVGVNADGNTFVVWRQIWESWGSIWSNRIDPGQDWDAMRTERIEDVGRAGRTPKIAVDKDRHAHALWLHSGGPGIEWVRTNRFE